MSKPADSPRSRPPRGRAAVSGGPAQPSLKSLARQLGLSPATISVVLNGSPVARAIPAATQRRIVAAAQAAGYRPNFLARSLRAGRSFSIGVMVPEVSEGYAALVLSGIEDHLLKEGYFYFVASHRHRRDLIDEYPRLLLERSVEGLIAVDTPLRQSSPVPVVSISGHHELPGVTNVRLNHRRAARLALEHLVGLGHRRIAFIKGQSFSSDTRVRWEAIQHAARALRLPLDPALVAQLEGDEPSPEPGFRAATALLEAGRPFTALFAFNDVSAIGALRALRGRCRVPEEVSVVGFDDIVSAAYQNPALTTVRQPLRRMGELAARTLLRRIAARDARFPKLLAVEPELVVRASTAPCPGAATRSRTPRAGGHDEGGEAEQSTAGAPATSAPRFQPAARFAAAAFASTDHGR